MEYKLENNVLRSDKELSDLDILVPDFVSILEECDIKCAIISGSMSPYF